jgi:hypothetical protein
MALGSAALEARARGAYERGRVVFGLKRAAAVAAVAGLALLSCTNVVATAGCVVLLAALVTVLLWRGQEFAEGVGPGLVAGLVPFVLPVASQATGYFCSATVCLVLPTVCVVGGVVGGVALGVLGRRPFGAHLGFWVAAVSVTAVLGSVGCLMAGLAGIAGLAVGLLLGAAPVLVARTA